MPAVVQDVRRAPVPAAAGLRERARRTAGFSHCLQLAVFVAGLALVLVGAALSMLSVLLALPAVLAGLWVWSTEFAWGRRLLGRAVEHAHRLRADVSARPATWALRAAASAVGCVVAYWAVVHYELLQRLWGLFAR